MDLGFDTFESSPAVMEVNPRRREFSFEDKRLKSFWLDRRELDLIVGDREKKRLAG